ARRGARSDCTIVVPKVACVAEGQRRPVEDAAVHGERSDGLGFLGDDGWVRAKGREVAALDLAACRPVGPSTLDGKPPDVVAGAWDRLRARTRLGEARLELASTVVRVDDARVVEHFLDGDVLGARRRRELFLPGAARYGAGPYSARVVG